MGYSTRRDRFRSTLFASPRGWQEISHSFLFTSLSSVSRLCTVLKSSEHQKTRVHVGNQDNSSSESSFPNNTHPGFEPATLLFITLRCSPPQSQFNTLPRLNYSMKSETLLSRTVIDWSKAASVGSLLADLIPFQFSCSVSKFFHSATKIHKICTVTQASA